MPIAVTCSACTRAFRVDDSLAGTAGTCPGCSRPCTLTGPQVPPFDVFISYSSKDQLVADAACAVLEGQGVRCWIAPRNLTAGEEWTAGIMHGLERSAIMVLVFSANSNDSRQVRREVERAVHKSMPIIPFRIEDVKPTGAMEYLISLTHWLDAYQPPLEEKLDQLAKSVMALLSSAAPGAAPAPPGETAGRVRRTASSILARDNRPRVLAGLGIFLLLAGGLFVLAHHLLKDPSPGSDSASKADARQPGEQPVANAPLASGEIYKRVVSSSAIVFGSKVRSISGSGSLIDRERKLVLTTYRAIDGATDIKVHFPKYHKDGKVIGNVNEYAPADMIGATIWKADSTRDLAILRVDSIPADARGIPLAAASPEPGDEVHMVGGNAANIGLWNYAKGNVRQVQEDRFILPPRRVDSWIILATNGVNPGDSGGALVNENGELVGVCSAIKISAGKEVGVFIDVREAKKLLASNSDASKPLDLSKLMGKWSSADGLGIEFSRDGKLIVSGNGKNTHGFFGFGDDKLTLDVDGKSETITVKALSDDRLVLVDSSGSEDVLRKVK